MGLSGEERVYLNSHCTKVGFACIAAANAAFWPAKIKVFKITLSKMTLKKKNSNFFFQIFLLF